MEEKILSLLVEMKNDISILGNKIDGLETRVNGIDAKIDNLEKRLDTKIDNLEKTLREEMSNMKSDICSEVSKELYVAVEIISKKIEEYKHDQDLAEEIIAKNLFDIEKLKRIK